MIYVLGTPYLYETGLLALPFLSAWFDLAEHRPFFQLEITTLRSQ